MNTGWSLRLGPVGLLGPYSLGFNPKTVHEDFEDLCDAVEQQNSCMTSAVNSEPHVVGLSASSELVAKASEFQLNGHFKNRQRLKYTTLLLDLIPTTALDIRCPA